MTVKEAEDLHNQAMAQADRALALKLSGKHTQAQELLKSAFELERRAADAVANMLDLEPTRSVLHRSAATLAMESDQTAIAEKLIHRGLAGEPPDPLMKELQDLLEQVTFKRHLELHGIELQDDEVQMAIAGKAVGYGIAPTDEFISRVSSTEKLLFRIAERQIGKPYRERGQTMPGLRGELELFLSVPRAASFSVTFKIGRGTQLALPGMDFAKAVVDEFLEELELFNEHDDSKLKQRIPDAAYYRNFTALARSIAPDGDAITTVGFTAVRDGKKRDVALVNTNPAPAEAPTEKRANREPTQILVGRLKAADALHQTKNRIKLLPDRGGRPETIFVPEGMMADIVRPMWGESVRVTAKRKRGTLELQTIEKVRPKAIKER